MACIKPIMTKRGGDGPFADLYVEHPCGQCKACRIRRKMVWTGRCLLEARSHLESSFLTLTYTDETRPEELNYPDIQEFLKRLRHSEPNIRYFVRGEYGDISGNAHWHLLLFGRPQRILGRGEMKQWPFGQVFDAPLNAHTIGYVTGYTLKIDKDKESITRMSLRPAIGKTHLVEMGRQLFKENAKFIPNRVFIGQKWYPLDLNCIRYITEGFEEMGGTSNRISPIHVESIALAGHERRGDPLISKRSLDDYNNRMRNGGYGKKTKL